MNKHGSRHAAHAAKALRWRIEQLLKCLVKIFVKELIRRNTLCLDPPLMNSEYSIQNRISLLVHNFLSSVLHHTFLLLFLEFLLCT